MELIIEDYTERIEKFKERLKNNTDGSKFYEKELKNLKNELMY